MGLWRFGARDSLFPLAFVRCDRRQKLFEKLADGRGIAGSVGQQRKSISSLQLFPGFADNLVVRRNCRQDVQMLLRVLSPIEAIENAAGFRRTDADKYHPVYRVRRLDERAVTVVAEVRRGSGLRIELNCFRTFPYTTEFQYAEPAGK